MIRTAGAGACCVVLLVALGWALLSISGTQDGLAATASARLSESGVRHPVTAVLLNFRGYDTLLEVAVLLLALVSVWSLRRADWPVVTVHDRPLLVSLLRIVLPILVLGAAYLLWIGAFAPGGAFQGGALLGGGLVLAILAGRGRSLLERERLLVMGLVVGLLVFLAAGLGSLGLTGELLKYPPGRGGIWILVIESAAMVSIGLTLGLLFLGGRPGAESVESGSSRGKEGRP